MARDIFFVTLGFSVVGHHQLQLSYNVSGRLLLRRDTHANRNLLDPTETRTCTR